MRLLIISDIHANLAAFEAVLDDAEGEWEQIWCLGDVIGYGPDPNECLSLLREHDHVTLTGNHDWAVLDKLDINSFNHEARTAIHWTQEEITEETRSYLAEQPPKLVKEPFTLAHASPRQPIWEYVMDQGTALVNFDYFDTAYCLVGHTHSPVIFEEVDSVQANINLPMYGEAMYLNGRMIINPGSVGQPRDSDPRAAYALLDTDAMTWEQRRVEYPIHVTQEKMRKAGLPYRLIARLEYGW